MKVVHCRTVAKKKKKKKKMAVYLDKHCSCQVFNIVSINSTRANNLHACVKHDICTCRDKDSNRSKF